MAVDFLDVLERAVDQLLGEGVVVARLLEVGEKLVQIGAEARGLVHAPGVKVLEGGGPPLATLGELAHDFFASARRSAAISRAARANSAPRLIRPLHRA